MNQEKIGKFIAKLRKEKGLTQQDLDEKLGVSGRTIGNWENGRNMPDLSLFKPLCEELGVTINELLSGEKLNKADYQQKLEENMIDLTIKSKQHFYKKLKIFVCLVLLLFIIFIIMLVIYNYYEIDVKYDKRLMKCSFKDNVLTYKIIGIVF